MEAVLRLCATLVISAALLLFARPATAADGCSCCDSQVAHCEKVVREVCITLKYTPRCNDYAHRCLTPQTPCPDCRVDLPCSCHKALTPKEPCAVEVCPEPVCHKPLVTAYPEASCGCATNCDCPE